MPDTNSLVSKQDLLALEERLTEIIHDLQTEVLRAFHDWASVYCSARTDLLERQ